MVQQRRILYEKLDVPDIKKMGVYLQHDGYKAAQKAFEAYQPDQIVEMVKTSGLKGRGGAGFLTGMKWSFVPKNIEPRYLCCNADESEPGTFSNRYVLEKNPHLLIEGIIIACYALGIHICYIYIRGEFTHGKKILDQALDETYEKGYLGKSIFGKGFDLEIYTHPGAGAYICGEETGLIESLEGKRGQPRSKPPFPAVSGLFNKPTVVQNVETLCNLPFIIANGVEWYRKMGVIYTNPRTNQEDPNSGTKLYCVSGHVNKPGVYELEMGLTCQELIEVAGGVRSGHKLKAVIPGGASAAILTPDELDAKMDFSALMLRKTMLGSGGIVVMDETVCMVDALLNIMIFFSHESCGQCTPCRWGTPWLRDIVDRIEHGKGRAEDLELIIDVAKKIGDVDTMTFNTICQFGVAVAWPAVSYVRKYRPEFEAHIKEGRCVILPPEEAKVSKEENYAIPKK